ncbi:hypothetical protein R3W88_004162 [Solanum pinnatisectum]|uniref:Retrotransposon gag domain-containing protein n=1 Tax=Solanum pinnatisectum TaxID=50273 RepID=A0AAV9K8J9_9SOLN|nr:hypothetical protein R3W88_004162 [Solanum pinnatisectum]
MDPPQFQGGKSKDAHECLTIYRELLEVVGLAKSHGVRYATLQLCGLVREWWREIFSSAFHDRFIPWSVREESHLRLENLRQDNLCVTEYEARFCQLSRHALTIISDETEMIRRFVRGQTFSIRLTVFRASREGASFLSIMSAAKEAELMEREVGFSRSAQQFSGKRFFFTCGDPDHVMRQCTFQRGRGGPQLNSSFQARPSGVLARHVEEIEIYTKMRLHSNGYEDLSLKTRK